MAYRTPEEMLKGVTVTKDYGNIRVKISTEDKLPKITLEPKPDLKVDDVEKGNFDVFEGMLKRREAPLGYEDISRLINTKGYATKLAEDVFIAFDTNLSKDSQGDMRLLPGLKGVIKEGLIEYKSKILENATPIFKSDFPIRKDDFL